MGTRFVIPSHIIWLTICHSCRTPTPQNIEEITARGRTLWQSIYTPQDVKLYNKLGSYHPDFIGASRADVPLFTLPHHYTLLSPHARSIADGFSI